MKTTVQRASLDSYDRVHRNPNPGFTLYQGRFYNYETKEERWRIVGITFAPDYRNRGVSALGTAGFRRGQE